MGKLRLKIRKCGCENENCAKALIAPPPPRKPINADAYSYLRCQENQNRLQQRKEALDSDIHPHFLDPHRKWSCIWPNINTLHVVGLPRKIKKWSCFWPNIDTLHVVGLLRKIRKWSCFCPNIYTLRVEGLPRNITKSVLSMPAIFSVNTLTQPLQKRMVILLNRWLFLPILMHLSQKHLSLNNM